MDNILNINVGEQTNTHDVPINSPSVAVESSQSFQHSLDHAQRAIESRASASPRTSVLESLAEEITQSLTGFNSLRFGMDDDMKRVVVRVMDKKTNSVIRQIPNDRMVDWVKQMRDLEGILFKATA